MNLWQSVEENTNVDKLQYNRSNIKVGKVYKSKSTTYNTVKGKKVKLSGEITEGEKLKTSGRIL